VFIGRWDVLKGARDLRKVIRTVRKEVPTCRFILLGTGVSSSMIKQDIDEQDWPNVRVIPTFRSQDLPKLLSDCTVGVFPSYTEGFGIAVLEKLASGLPCVAYDIPGPREMLGQIKPPLMVSAGDTDAMSRRLLWLLQISVSSYLEMGRTCRATAFTFRWREIAERILDFYRHSLAEMNRSEVKDRVEFSSSD
jgi:glycosyltransferase involved in cell wall biosynthesis